VELSCRPKDNSLRVAMTPRDDCHGTTIQRSAADTQSL
jgi:hypothetical protein